jgi:hypothetical protein
VEGEENFVPFEVSDGTEVDNGVFFFRVVRVAVFALVGATGGTFAVAFVGCDGWEVKVVVGGSHGRSRRWWWWWWTDVWYFAECRHSRGWG